nr:hypothetical protein [Tanacetum cinerariifolium]
HVHHAVNIVVAAVLALQRGLIISGIRRALRRGVLEALRNAATVAGAGAGGEGGHAGAAVIVVRLQARMAEQGQVFLLQNLRQASAAAGVFHAGLRVVAGKADGDVVRIVVGHHLHIGRAGAVEVGRVGAASRQAVEAHRVLNTGRVVRLGVAGGPAAVDALRDVETQLGVANLDGGLAGEGAEVAVAVQQ